MPNAGPCAAGLPHSRSQQGHPLSPTALFPPAHVPTRQPTQYGVSPNSAILAEEQHQPLFKELVDDYAVKYIAGGATQNSCRVCQWMTGTPGATSYFGCIGDDAFGKQMTDEAAAIGMNVQYLVDPEQVRGGVTRLWCMVRHPCNPCMLTDRLPFITDD